MDLLSIMIVLLMIYYQFCSAGKGKFYENLEEHLTK